MTIRNAMRHRTPDYTGQTLEWSDADFEIAIPGVNGSVSAGIFTVRVPMIGIGGDLFEPAERFTLAHNEAPDHVVVFDWTESSWPPPKSFGGAFAFHVTTMLNARMDKINEWCVDEAARQDLGEPDADIMRDDLDGRRRLEVAE